MRQLEQRIHELESEVRRLGSRFIHLCCRLCFTAFCLAELICFIMGMSVDGQARAAKSISAYKAREHLQRGTNMLKERYATLLCLSQTICLFSFQSFLLSLGLCFAVVVVIVVCLRSCLTPPSVAVSVSCSFSSSRQRTPWSICSGCTNEHSSRYRMHTRNEVFAISLVRLTLSFSTARLPFGNNCVSLLSRLGR